MTKQVLTSLSIDGDLDASGKASANIVRTTTDPGWLVDGDMHTNSLIMRSDGAITFTDDRSAGLQLSASGLDGLTYSTLDGTALFRDDRSTNQFSFYEALSCTMPGGHSSAPAFSISDSTQTHTAGFSVDGSTTITTNFDVDGNGIWSATVGGTLAVPPRFSIDADATVSSSITFAGTTYYSGVRSLAAFSSSQNDYSVGGASSFANVIRITPNGSSLSITGMANFAANRRVVLVNVSSTNDVTLTHNSTSSSVGNRFLCPGNANYTLKKNGSVELWYDSASSAIRVMG